MPVPPKLFKQALAQHASGVTVVTASQAGRRLGFTATSFTSVSLEPPLVLVCAARTLDALAAIEGARAFAVNVLGDHQHDLGLRFAGLLPPVSDRFDGIDTVTSITGSPLLPGSLAWLDCRLHDLHEGGDHRIVVGEVVDAHVNAHRQPLLYHDRQWRRPAALQSAASPPETPGTNASVGDLGNLLRQLEPELDPERYVFLQAPQSALPGGTVIGSFEEREGTTCIATAEAARRAGLGGHPEFRRITLRVNSDLLAVGLISAVSATLADAAIPCNVVSAARHDHLFVPDADAPRALECLLDLQLLAGAVADQPGSV